MACALISLIILTSYIIAVCWKWGVPKSVSQTFFSIRHKWIFSAVIAASACLLISPLLEILPDEFQWLGFFTSAGCIIVAFAPNLADKLEERVHMTGAIILGLASQGVVIVLQPWLMLSWLCWIPIAFKSSRIFWAEMIGGLTLYASIIIYMAQI